VASLGRTNKRKDKGTKAIGGAGGNPKRGARRVHGRVVTIQLQEEISKNPVWIPVERPAQPSKNRTGFGAALASVGTFSKGSRTVRCLPALPCRLRAMRPAV